MSTVPVFLLPRNSQNLLSVGIGDGGVIMSRGPHDGGSLLDVGPELQTGRGSPQGCDGDES